MSDIVVAKELRKTYGAFQALDGCSLTIETGSVFGLLGPNGAGKTTFIRTLLGFIKPTSGSAEVQGISCVTDSVRVRSIVSYLPAEAKLFGMMRGRAVLEFFSAMNPNGNLQYATSIAKRLDLDLSRLVAFMSTGMRQKLAIACVMSCRSPLMILDEPTANLDPNVRLEVLKLVRQAKSDGATVLFSSHVLSEIEDVCDTATVMLKGKVVKSFNVVDMRATHRIVGVPNAFWNEWSAKHFDSLKMEMTDVTVLEQNGTRVVVDIVGPIQNHLKWLSDIPLDQMRIEPVGLRSVYESCCVSS